MEYDWFGAIAELFTRFVVLTCAVCAFTFGLVCIYGLIDIALNML